MILEEGTSEQLRECAFQACLPRPRSRWVYIRRDGLQKYHFTVLSVANVVMSDNMADLSRAQWVLLVAEGRLLQNELFTWSTKFVVD